MTATLIRSVPVILEELRVKWTGCLGEIDRDEDVVFLLWTGGLKQGVLSTSDKATYIDVALWRYKILNKMRSSGQSV